MRRVARSFALVVLALALAACAGTQPQRNTGFVRPAGEATVLVMPPDVETGVVTAAGMYKPRADWTEAAQRHLGAAIEAELTARAARVVHYPGPLAAEHVQPVKLVGALEQTLLTHVHGARMGGAPRLPTKTSGLDWTLGDAVAPLREASGADYVLFVHVRDQAPSGGRTAANIAMALLFGAIATSDDQVGFATLLDLRTGQLLWTNLAANAFGHVREPAGAASAARALLAEFPL